MLLACTKGLRLLVFLMSVLPVVYLKRRVNGGDSMLKKKSTYGGADSKDGSKVFYCPAGPPGPPGPPGPQGVPGRDGRDGWCPARTSNEHRPGCPPPPPCPSPPPCPTSPPCPPPPPCAKVVPARPVPALGTVNNPAWSCQELFAANPQLNSGPYWLKSTEHEPYQVHCEMLKAAEGADRGGWTLVARVDGHTNDFAGISPTWTNSDLINEEEASDLSKTSSMKNYGWGHIITNTIMACFSGPRTNCATFNHNKGMTLAKLFKTQFAIDTTEHYTFKKLMGKFGKSLDISQLKTEWCGLNLGDLCNMAHPPSKYHGTHVCRIGCIGDSSGSDEGENCHPQDYALGIGVAVCHRHKNKRCTLKDDSSKSLHYRTLGKRHGSYPQTAFIYIK